ncbi:unnamed protein product [Rangifer tarandus platyrhynchus]|uniref:Uncharacterized protein n=1 Tax=Rangifer tarandus platyrhynchus TaxID=3082113 RepID=A0AC59YNH5_RANTA
MWHRRQIVQQHSLPSYQNSQFLAGSVTIENIVSPLHTNLQVANCQRCKHAYHQRQVRVKLQLALHLLLLTTLQPYHHSPALVSNSPCLFTQCQPLCASHCTVLY